MFAILPVYNAATQLAETRLLQPALIRQVAPHADVTISGTASPCVQVFFSETDSLVVLLDMNTLIQRLQALTGLVDDYGTLTTAVPT